MHGALQPDFVRQLFDPVIQAVHGQCAAAQRDHRSSLAFHCVPHADSRGITSLASLSMRCQPGFADVRELELLGW